MQMQTSHFGSIPMREKIADQRASSILPPLVDYVPQAFFARYHMEAGKSVKFAFIGVKTQLSESR